jgi:hypothetical protein
MDYPEMVIVLKNFSLKLKIKFWFLRKKQLFLDLEKKF